MNVFEEDDEYYDDDMDEESIDGKAFEEGYYSTCYADKTEREQWDEDNLDCSYDEALADDEEYGTNTIPEWQEYRDEKSACDDSDEFPSFSDWKNSKNGLEESED